MLGFKKDYFHFEMGQNSALHSFLVIKKRFLKGIILFSFRGPVFITEIFLLNPLPPVSYVLLSVAGPVIQANVRLSFEDDLRCGGLLYCVSQ